MFGQLLDVNKKRWIDLCADQEGNQLVSSLRSAWRDDFNGNDLNPLAWTIVQNDAGQTISVAGGELTIDAGTDANAVTIIRSVGMFSIPFRAWLIGRISQRIANQEIRLEIVNAAGDMKAGWLLDGTSATQGKYYSANGGNLNESAASNIPTMATDNCVELELFVDEFWAIQRGVDSTATRTNSYCLTRNIPNPDEPYYLQISVANGATPPASDTQLILGAVAVQDINELTAEITGGRGDDKGAKSIAVAVANMPAVTSAPMASVGCSVHKTIVSAASTNAGLVKNGATVLHWLNVANASASWRWLKLYNKTVAPTVGTDIPALTIGIPPNNSINVANAVAARFAIGLAYAITAGPADSDATAIGANEVVAAFSYT